MLGIDDDGDDVPSQSADSSREEKRSVINLVSRCMGEGENFFSFFFSLSLSLARRMHERNIHGGLMA